MSGQTVQPPLSQGWGYGVIFGIGFAFAFAMMWITHLLRKYSHENNSNFETYSTAGRSIGVGLTATAVISSWAWSTALLSSSTMAYKYGVAGAYWYGAGCIVQICSFSILAIQSKLKTPHAHTILEVVKARYGAVAHIIYMALCLINNLIAVVNMLLGASASVSALTGMHEVASIFLLPIGVCLYTISGGLRATFVTDWAHSIALFIIVAYLCIKTLTNPNIGSLSNLWNFVHDASIQSPVHGNYNGFYLTMTSPGAVQFGILHTLNAFGLVLMDSSYWQKAYSANITAAVPGYLLGGVLYFGLPWGLGTVMGLGSLALQHFPSWPTFGRSLSTDEVNAGLVLPYTGISVAGGAGAVAVLLVVFMAVTSTMSAELIAVSSIVSSDIFHTYIKPDATGKQIINVSHAACIVFTVIGCAVSVAVYYAGVTLTWTLYFLGVITCPGMVTLPLTVLWSRQTRLAAIVSPLLGLIGGLSTWIMTAKHYGEGVISVETTGLMLPCMWGTIASAGIPLVCTVTLSLVFPDKPFSWKEFDKIELVADEPDITDPKDEKLDNLDEEEKIDYESICDTQNSPTFASPSMDLSPDQVKYMKTMSLVSGIFGIFAFLIVWIVWPFSMYGARFEFSSSFFSGWVVVSVIWIFITLLVITILPPIDGRHQIWTIVCGVLKRKQSDS